MNRFPTSLCRNDLKNFPSFIFVHRSSSGVGRLLFYPFQQYSDFFGTRILLVSHAVTLHHFSLEHCLGAVSPSFLLATLTSGLPIGAFCCSRCTDSPGVAV